MARIAALMELRPTDRRKPQEARYDQGRHASPNRDVSIKQILEDLSTTPEEEVLKKIGSLPRTRQHKVLDIRRQLTTGTYEVASRLDRVIDRILEAITA